MPTEPFNSIFVQHGTIENLDGTALKQNELSFERQASHLSPQVIKRKQNSILKPIEYLVSTNNQSSFRVKLNHDQNVSIRELINSKNVNHRFGS